MQSDTLDVRVSLLRLACNSSRLYLNSSLNQPVKQSIQSSLCLCRSRDLPHGLWLPVKPYDEQGTRVPHFESPNWYHVDGNLASKTT